MIVVLNRERLVAPLPDMPRGVVVPVVAEGLGRQQPAHPPAQVAIGLWPQYEMEMVGHEAIAEDIHRDAADSLRHGVDEGIIISRLVEDRGAAIAAIQGVVNQASDG